VQSSIQPVHVDPFTLIFWGIVILAFLLRFYDLASKPLHHDESLYGVYCWRFFKGEGYRYDPMMHGPFMFHFQLLVFFLFGVGDFSVRIAPALLGTLMVAGTYYLKDYLGKIGVLVVALALTFSPTHLYFSRFMRHDIYIAFFTYTAVIFGLLYYHTRHNRYLYLAAASLSLMFCVKENAYIHVFIFMTFIFIKDFCQTHLYKTASSMTLKPFIGWLAGLFISVCSVLLLVYFSKNPLPPILTRLMEKGNWAVFILVVTQLCLAGLALLYWIYDYRRRARLTSDKQTYALIFGAFIFAWIYILLYSTFFTNRIGVLDGLAKSWMYWSNQHSIQRIKGSFHYYVPFMFLYEFPILFIIAGGAVSAFGKILYTIEKTLDRTIIVFWATLFSGYLIVHFGSQQLPSWLQTTGFLETLADFILGIYITGILVWALIHSLMHWETFTFRELLSYWTMRGFLIYTMFSGFLVIRFGRYPLPQERFGFTHMEILADLVLALYGLCVALWTTLHFLRQRKTLAAFLAYWSAIGFLIYSYAGEKVPWLFLHILLPAVLLSGILLNQFFTSKVWHERNRSFKIVRIPIIVTGLFLGIYTLHSTVLLNFYHPANPVETMVYTQTSTDILTMLEVIRDVEFSLGSEEAKKPFIAVQGNAVWPLAWYLRDYEGWYHPGDLSKIRRPLIVIDWEDREKYQEVFEEEYQEIQVKLREWWIPQSDGTLKDWWNYFLLRKVFSPTGSSDVAFYIKR
jgi:uncharacterized protein (TIGR03663 family)